MNRRTVKKNILIIVILTVIFIISVYFAAFSGYKDWGFHLFKRIFSLNGDTDSILLEVLRLPRVMKAVIAGSCLAISGMFMQSVSKNPLAEPYITGISSGAGLGIIVSILFFNGINYALFGFTGALICAVFVITFCGLSRLSVTKLILIGLSVNMFAGSIISFAILTNPDKAYPMLYILSGGVSESYGVFDYSLVVMFFASLLPAALLIPKLNFLRLDDNLLPGMEKRKNIYTFMIILTSSLLAALSVFAAGILGFIGIIAPQISKMLAGHDYRWLFLINILIGSIFILTADLISRCIIYPLQVPLGVVVALIGAPVFVYFLLKNGDFFND